MFTIRALAVLSLAVNLVGGPACLVEDCEEYGHECIDLFAFELVRPTAWGDRELSVTVSFDGTELSCSIGAEWSCADGSVPWITTSDERVLLMDFGGTPDVVHIRVADAMTSETVFEIDWEPDYHESHICGMTCDEASGRFDVPG